MLDDGGFISLFDTRENPAALRSRWTSPQPLGHYTCLALYEQAMDEVGGAWEGPIKNKCNVPSGIRTHSLSQSFLLHFRSY